MNIEIKVPPIGESITDVTLTKWIKKTGEWVERDEVIAELESEKATFEINAEQAGLLSTIVAEGTDMKVGEIVCSIDTAASKPEIHVKPETKSIAENISANTQIHTKEITANDFKSTPVAAAIILDKHIDTKSITATGYGGKILKNDVLGAISSEGKIAFSREKSIEKMSNLRKTVSRRLVEAKNTTAMLTTFNEVDMSAIMEIRSKFKDKFKEKYGVNLGFMSFFTSACCFALQEFPSVNAMIDDEKIVYHDYCDISIAISAPKGLVVPVIRNAESLTMADIEKKIVELSGKAKENKLSFEEMSGGTFTITNGGVFGSLMSTPIINIPQSGILGMHKIQDRPMAVNGQVMIKPMMYLALTYDHRIIDGRESVSFLVKVKELLENPVQLLFGKDPIKKLLDL